MSMGKSIRRSFWRGLAALLPALLTFIVLAFGISLVQKYLGQYVNQAIVYGLHLSSGMSMDDAGAWYDRYWLGWLGVVVAIIGLCLAAYLVGTFIGGRIVRLLEGTVVRLPLLRRIYPGAKQVSEFFFSDRAVEFRRVVAIEFPRKGMWMVGFVTGRGLKEIADRAGTELLSVFIPFSPAPITGYVVAVPREEVVDLAISVDEAFQFLISAGVIVPPAERVESLKESLRLSHEEAHALAQSVGGTASAKPSKTRSEKTDA